MHIKDIDTHTHAHTQTQFTVINEIFLYRFNLLMGRYQNVKIQIVSDSNLDTKEDLIQLLQDITATTPLGGVFFATMVIIA